MISNLSILEYGKVYDVKRACKAFDSVAYKSLIKLKKFLFKIV